MHESSSKSNETSYIYIYTYIFHLYVLTWLYKKLNRIVYILQHCNQKLTNWIKLNQKIIPTDSDLITNRFRSNKITDSDLIYTDSDSKITNRFRSEETLKLTTYSG